MSAILLFQSLIQEELWLTKLLSKWQNQKLNLFELANTIKSFAKFLKTSEVDLWYRLDFKPMLSHVSLLKLVLEMDERIQILQKILPAEKWSLQTYKAFQFFKRQRNRKITKKIYFCLF